MDSRLVGYSPWGHKELDTTEATYHSHTQWLEHHAFTAEGATGLISGQGTKFPQASQHGQNQKQQQRKQQKDGHVKTEVEVGVIYL